MSHVEGDQAGMGGGEMPAGVVAGGDLGECLLQRQMITTEQLATAKRVLKQTPGKRLAQVLIEMGVDEDAVQVEDDVARRPFARRVVGAGHQFLCSALLSTVSLRSPARS